jgi:hypothetical protein
MARRFGTLGKYSVLLEMFKEARDTPRGRAVLAKLAESDPDAPAIFRDAEGRVDFPIYLQTVIRHRMRERFKTRAGVYQRYVGNETAEDFREHTVSQLGGLRGIDGVPEYSDYPRLYSAEEAGPSYAVGKYGGIYSVTFELIVNDDYNRILNRIPTELGRAMGEFQNQAMIALIESNPTYGPDGQPFFSAAHDNNITGTAADITADNLVAIIDKLRTRRDAEGLPIDIELGRILVRNPSQKFKLDQIVRSQITGIRMETTAVGAPSFAPSVYNPLSNVIPPDGVIEDPWLNDVDDWYVLADADERPAFVEATLRNRRAPDIVLTDSGMRGVGGGASDPYEMDGDDIPYKIRHIFGGAPGEPQAAIRMQP